MSLEKLQDTRKMIERYESQIEEISRQIAAAYERKTKEESTQLLLRYGISTLDQQIKKEEEDVKKLTKERDDSAQTFNQLFCLMKRQGNKNIINNICCEWKEQSLEKLHDKATILDFEIEARGMGSQ